MYVYIYITCVWFLSPAFTHVPARPGLKADQCGCQQFHIRPDRIWEDNRCWDRLVRFLIPPPSRNLGTLPRLKGSRYRVRPSQTPKKKNVVIFQSFFWSTTHNSCWNHGFTSHQHLRAEVSTWAAAHFKSTRTAGSLAIDLFDFLWKHVLSKFHST